MKFKTYLDKKKIRPHRWAVENNIPSATVWRAYKGIGFPDWHTVIRIQAATMGAVKFADWSHLKRIQEAMND